MRKIAILLALLPILATAQIKESIVRVPLTTTAFMEKYYPPQLIRHDTILYTLTHATLIGQTLKTVLDSGWYKIVSRSFSGEDSVYVAYGSYGGSSGWIRNDTIFVDTVENDPVWRNDKKNYRTLSNHDSLSTLDEKNYNSLTNIPNVRDSIYASYGSVGGITGWVKNDTIFIDTARVSSAAADSTNFPWMYKNGFIVERDTTKVVMIGKRTNPQIARLGVYDNGGNSDAYGIYVENYEGNTALYGSGGDVGLQGFGGQKGVWGQNDSPTAWGGYFENKTYNDSLYMTKSDVGNGNQRIVTIDTITGKMYHYNMPTGSGTNYWNRTGGDLRPATWSDTVKASDMYVKNGIEFSDTIDGGWLIKKYAYFPSTPYDSNDFHGIYSMSSGSGVFSFSNWAGKVGNDYLNQTDFILVDDLNPYLSLKTRGGRSYLYRWDSTAFYPQVLSGSQYVNLGTPLYKWGRGYFKTTDTDTLRLNSKITSTSDSILVRDGNVIKYKILSGGSSKWEVGDNAGTITPISPYYAIHLDSVDISCGGFLKIGGTAYFTSQPECSDITLQDGALSIKPFTNTSALNTYGWVNMKGLASNATNDSILTIDGGNVWKVHKSDLGYQSTANMKTAGSTNAAHYYNSVYVNSRIDSVGNLKSPLAGSSSLTTFGAASGTSMTTNGAMKAYQFYSNAPQGGQYYFRNKGSTSAWTAWASTDTTGAATLMNLSNLGTIANTGNITTTSGSQISSGGVFSSGTTLNLGYSSTTTRLTLTASNLSPNTNNTLDLGTDGISGFKNLFLVSVGGSVKINQPPSNNVAGGNLTLQGGTNSSTSGKNLSGGAVLIYPGASGGTAKKENIVMYRNGRSATDATGSGNTQMESLMIAPMKNLVDATNDTLLSFAFDANNADSVFECNIEYGVVCRTSAGSSNENGQYYVNASVWQGNITGYQFTSTNVQTLRGYSTPTLSSTLSLVATTSGTGATLKVTAIYVIVNYDSSLNPTAGQMKMRYNVNMLAGTGTRTQY